jgi:hypothetical protein
MPVKPSTAKPTKTPTKAKVTRRGSAGTRGPVPKRSTERRRRNKDSSVEKVAITGLGPVPVPDPDPKWHPIAVDWYRSLAESGQSKFYEPSDWQYARILAEMLTRLMKQGQKVSSMLLSAVQSGMADLLTTEADRRRVRMEIERELDDGAAGDQAGVAVMDDYRKRLAGASGG